MSKCKHRELRRAEDDSFYCVEPDCGFEIPAGAALVYLKSDNPAYPLLNLLKRAYDELPQPSHLGDAREYLRISTLRGDILNAICPIQPPSEEDVFWAKQQRRGEGQ